jgi:hypothetical protein
LTFRYQLIPLIRLTLGSYDGVVSSQVTTATTGKPQNQNLTPHVFASVYTHDHAHTDRSSPRSVATTFFMIHWERKNTKTGTTITK